MSGVIVLTALRVGPSIAPGAPASQEQGTVTDGARSSKLFTCARTGLRHRKTCIQLSREYRVLRHWAASHGMLARKISRAQLSTTGGPSLLADERKVTQPLRILLICNSVAGRTAAQQVEVPPSKMAPRIPQTVRLFDAPNAGRSVERICRNYELYLIYHIGLMRSGNRRAAAPQYS